MREQAEELLNRLDELVMNLKGIASSADLTEKREQLRVVSQSIQQLESRSIPVPDTLRHLKMDLVSELGVADEAEEILVFLRGALAEVMQTLSSKPTSARGEQSPGPQPTQRRTRKRRDDITPMETWRRLVVEALKAKGGKAPCSEVLDLINERMEGKFLSGDLGSRKDGHPVWRNNIQWERYNMIRDGILKSDSPRGIWELNEDA